MRRRRTTVLFMSLAAVIAAGFTVTQPVAATTGSTELSARIVGGNAASTVDTPWFVSLRPVVHGWTYICGGTIIDAYWIVTAAHCVTRSQTGQSSGDVSASSYFINPASASSMGIRGTWAGVLVHPGWNPDTQQNDVALIRTTARTSAVPLPYSSDTAGPIAGTPLEVFGFGHATFGGSTSKELRVALVDELAGTNGPCGTYGSGYYPSSMICAGKAAGGIDACQGDSGGPLTTVVGERRLVGIVSTGTGCALAEYPGIYSRVSSFAVWIQEATGIAPDRASTSFITPASLSVGPRCTKSVCVIRTGKKLKVVVLNSGGTSSSWAIKAGNLRKSASHGRIQPGRQKPITLSPRNPRRSCVAVRVTGAGKKVSVFKIRVNGYKRKCRL